MKKEFIALLLAALTVSVFASDPNPTASASAAPSDAEVNTVCPVSGNRIVGFIGKPLYAQYQGQNIAVCCSECLTKFQNLAASSALTNPKWRGRYFTLTARCPLK